jgi:tetratricopeptide (TPR) repeat protein
VDPVLRARLLASRSILLGASGRFDEARASLAEAATNGRPGYDSVLLSKTTRLELLARNFRRAEELARELCAGYRALGLTSFLSSEQMYLVDALLGQGRLGEAAVELETAPAPEPDDTDALFRQARSHAALELARGELEAAEEHARAAAAYTDGIELPDEHCQTLLVLARVLLEQGRHDEAHSVLEETIAFSSRRENVVLEQRARELLSTTELAGAA